MGVMSTVTLMAFTVTLWWDRGQTENIATRRIGYTMLALMVLSRWLTKISMNDELS